MTPAFDKKTSVAFMGAENSTVLDNLDIKFQRTLFEFLTSLYDGGYRYFYTALLEGLDLIAAEIIEMMKMRGGRDEAQLVAVVTTENQAADYAPENRAQFTDLLTRADHLHIVGHQLPGSKLAIMDEFVEKCATIVCWDDGEDPDLTFTLDKARTAGLQVVNINEIS
jgi:uncharacterized phage-like protein YoqJ